jgi:hypothetical protein
MSREQCICEYCRWQYAEANTGAVDGPEGETQGMPSNVVRVLDWETRIVGPIHGTNPASRGQPAAVQSRSRRFRRLRRQDAGANIGEAEGLKSEAEDVPSNVVRPSAGRLGLLVPSMGPTPLCGASLRLSTMFLTKLSNVVRLLCSTDQHKKPAI